MFLEMFTYFFLGIMLLLPLHLHAHYVQSERYICLVILSSILYQMSSVCTLESLTSLICVHRDHGGVLFHRTMTISDRDLDQYSKDSSPIVIYEEKGVVTAPIHSIRDRSSVVDRIC